MKISEDVVDVLRRCSVEGRALTLPEQLDRKLYVKVNDVLVAVGGKWDRRAKAHLFHEDPEEAIQQAIALGEITTAKDLGFFPTPPEVVDRLLELACLAPGLSVLEPSAGRGAIAFPAARQVREVHVCELDPKNYKELQRLSFATSLHNGDFLAIQPRPVYDRVIMNPPFGKQADIHHVQHALKFLKPDGRLVAVMSAGVLFRENKLAADFRHLVVRRNGTLEELPPGAFKVSGTMVRTIVVTIPGEDA